MILHSTRYVHTTPQRDYHNGFHDEVYHSVPAISMSHEQNMHHHLIYLATTVFNTNETRLGCNLLISIQVTSCLVVTASYNSCPGQPPSTAWLLGDQLYPD